MNEKKEKEITEEVATTKPLENSTANNTDLEIKKVIEKIDLLSQNDNPYLVSKEIEELKSIFYIKLKEKIKTQEIIILEKIPTTEQDESSQEKSNENTLHPLEINFKTIYRKFKKLKFEYRKKRDRQEVDNFKTKQQIIADIDKLTQEDESIKKTFEHFRILQKQWENTGHVPQSEKNNLWQSYHHHVELFYDYIKLNNDLRDLDFTRNLEEKTAIYEKAEALLNEKSFNKVNNTLQELHEHWKNVGPVKKELREELWKRFQNISKTLNKKRNDYFLKEKEKNQKKLIKKEEICKKIDALTLEVITSHKQWSETTNQCSELEKEWKDIGRLNKTQNRIAWRSLRTVLNNFYNKKNAYYKQKKEEGKSILKVKISICEKSEELQNSTDWQVTGNQLIRLQNDWKNAGFSSADQSNKIWKRFKAACDTFFNARKAHYKTMDKEKEGALKDKKELLLTLKEFKASANSKDDIKQLKEFSNQWKKIGYIPRDKMKIDDEFFDLINAKFEELGLSKKVLAEEQYKNKINSIKGNDKAISSEKQFLRLKIDSLKKEIYQYENNISFFGRNKSTEPLKKQVEEQIAKANTEIGALKQKLQFLKKG
ncbi:MAG: DUF349 domain-containing protein [Flavobacteriales bacterium]|nr:DUF349 domain-containing protein [Flavobacteriales bacterium]MBT5090165.1 DUF349 domain-containing protein [Flavobacteriales bacterium]MBT5750189.1 DUF349 domain-containing protein [Flavobacteriales bacterium]